MDLITIILGIIAGVAFIPVLFGVFLLSVLVVGAIFAGILFLVVNVLAWIINIVTLL
jgi:hypothetical protein